MAKWSINFSLVLHKMLHIRMETFVIYREKKKQFKTNKYILLFIKNLKYLLIPYDFFSEELELIRKKKIDSNSRRYRTFRLDAAGYAQLRVLVSSTELVYARKFDILPKNLRKASYFLREKGERSRRFCNANVLNYYKRKFTLIIKPELICF